MATGRASLAEDPLGRIVAESAWFMAALGHVRALGLASWCIGAGALRDLVWDTLHDRPDACRSSDLDVAWFDASDLSQATDVALQAELTRRAPTFPWEVTNQAAVHRWFESCFGHPVEPLASLEAAVASWPEYATSVGATLRHDGTLAIIAPHGLDDLLNMVVRRNPMRVSAETYAERIAGKPYLERWPGVTVLR